MVKEILGGILHKVSAVLAVAVVCLAGYSVAVTKKYNGAREKAGSLENTITDMRQELKAFEVRLNDSTVLHAATVKNLKMTADNIQARYDKLLKASSIKKKDVNQVSTVSTVSVDTVFVPVTYDSFGGLKTSYSDRFIDISVCVDAAKMATVAYSSRDSLSLIVTQKKHSILFGLFKWKSLEKTTVINHNPRATVTSLETIDVIE